MNKLTYIKDGRPSLAVGASLEDALKKLAKFEQLDEFGNLFALPKIGDKVYTVKACRINTVRVAYIVIGAGGVFVYDYRLLPHRLGVDCFLTKHDAKKAAKRTSTANK